MGIRLNRLGHVVKLTSDGKECFDEFKIGKYDLILMDVEMPVSPCLAFDKKRYARDLSRAL
jgi:CheY-like chemotaxis protein